MVMSTDRLDITIAVDWDVKPQTKAHMVVFQELLEKALGGLLKKQDENCTNARELDKLIQQQRTIERELSRVLQQLAESSKVTEI